MERPIRSAAPVMRTWSPSRSREDLVVRADCGSGETDRLWSRRISSNTSIVRRATRPGLSTGAGSDAARWSPAWCIVVLPTTIASAPSSSMAACPSRVSRSEHLLFLALEEVVWGPSRRRRCRTDASAWVEPRRSKSLLVEATHSGSIATNREREASAVARAHVARPVPSTSIGSAGPQPCDPGVGGAVDRDRVRACLRIARSPSSKQKGPSATSHRASQRGSGSSACRRSPPASTDAEAHPR